MPLAFARSVLAGGAAEPTYTITSNKVSVNEGDSVTFTLTTENVDVGTNVPYTITGISSADIGGTSLTGNFTIEADGTDDLTFSLTEDAVTEGTENFLITLDVIEAVGSVSVTDTSRTPTYSLSRSASAINEGQSVTFYLTTTNIANGTNVPYTLSGIQSADIGYAPLSGNFNVSNNAASVTITLTADVLNEGNETMTISAGGTSTNCLINDTSRASTYTLTTFSDTTPNEGDTVSFTVTTVNVNETMYYEVQGSSTDFTGYSGAMTLSSTTNINGGLDTQRVWTGSFVVVSDSLTEGNESYWFRVTTGNTISNGGLLRLSQYFTVQDTSLSIDFFSSSISNTGINTGGFNPHLGIDQANDMIIHGGSSSSMNLYYRSSRSLWLSNRTVGSNGTGNTTLYGGYSGQLAFSGYSSYWNVAGGYWSNSTRTWNGGSNGYYNSNFISNGQFTSDVQPYLNGSAWTSASVKYPRIFECGRNNSSTDLNFKIHEHTSGGGSTINQVSSVFHNYNTHTGRTLNTSWSIITAHDPQTGYWYLFTRGDVTNWGTWCEVWNPSDSSTPYLGRFSHGIPNMLNATISRDVMVMLPRGSTGQAMRVKTSR